MSDLLLVAGIVLAAGPALIAFQRWNRYRQAQRTGIHDPSKVYQEQFAQMGIARETFDEVYTVVSHAYQIPRNLIKPDMTFEQLWRLNVFDLGHGNEEVGRWIRERIGDTGTRQILTVGDLLLLVSAHEQAATRPS